MTHRTFVAHAQRSGSAYSMAIRASTSRRNSTMKRPNAEPRRWRDNTFKSGSFAELDAFIVERATGDWQRAVKVAGALMAAGIGFFVSDRIAFWRCWEAAAAGHIELRGKLQNSR